MALFSRTPKASASDLEALRAELEQLRSELTKRTNELSMITAATNGLDQRLVVIDTRLTNQLHEMGNEMQSLAEQQSDPMSASALEQLRVSQIRIANEQARYEIAFRQDLAALAEHFSRIK